MPQDGEGSPDGQHRLKRSVLFSGVCSSSAWFETLSVIEILQF